MNMARSVSLVAFVSAVIATLWTGDASVQTVKVTPLGSHTGELCQNDRALLFEDPTGVRILYDVGTAVAGAGDPRLGEVHVVLLSHAHGDHIGDQKAAGINAGTCERPETAYRRRPIPTQSKLRLPRTRRSSYATLMSAS